MNTLKVNRVSLVVLFLFTFLLSCDPANSVRSQQSSVGEIDEVILVLDNEDIALGIDSVLYAYLAKPYPVLPQYEPSLRVRILSMDKFKGVFKRYRHVIFAGHLTGTNAMSAEINKQLGPKAKEFTDSNTVWFAVKKDQHARPQQKIYLFAKNAEDLIKGIEHKHDPIISQIQNFENSRLAKGLFSRGSAKSIEDLLKTRYKFIINIPKEFTIVEDFGDTVWMRKETVEESINIIVHKFDCESLPSSGIPIRNAIGKVLIGSKKDGSYMVSDSILPFEYYTDEINGVAINECRGLWSLEGDFMGGPFINYLFTNRNGQCIMIDGFIYAPHSKKKILMRHLETIIASLEI